MMSNEVHFVPLADKFTAPFSKPPWKTKKLNGPWNYRELRETGPWAATVASGH